MGWSLNPVVRLLREGLKKTRALWGVENTELSEEQLWGLCNLPVALPAHHGAMKHAWAPDLEVAPTTAASINYNRLVPNTNSWFVCNYKKKKKKNRLACAGLGTVHSLESDLFMKWVLSVRDNESREYMQCPYNDQLASIPPTPKGKPGEHFLFPGFLRPVYEHPDVKGHLRS